MNIGRNDSRYSSSKNGRRRREVKAVLRSIYDTLGPHPGYHVFIDALHACGYKCGQTLARELVRTLWLPDQEI